MFVIVYVLRLIPELYNIRLWESTTQVLLQKVYIGMLLSYHYMTKCFFFLFVYLYRCVFYTGIYTDLYTIPF